MVQLGKEVNTTLEIRNGRNEKKLVMNDAQNIIYRPRNISEWFITQDDEVLNLSYLE